MSNSFEVLYVVKNEDLWLGKSIENLLAGRVKADTITVVDTGSEDDTVIMVCNLGVRLIQIQMEPKDLGKVKNFYLKQAKTAAVLNLDGNEILPVKSVEVLDDILNCVNWEHLTSLGLPFLEVDEIEETVNAQGEECWKIGYRGAPIIRARLLNKDRVSFRRGYPNLRMGRPGISLSTYPKKYFILHMRRLGQSSKDKEIYKGHRHQSMIDVFSKFPLNYLWVGKKKLLL